MYKPHKEYNMITPSIIEELTMHHRLDMEYNHRQRKRDLLSVSGYRYKSGYKASRFLQNIQKDILTYIVLAQNTDNSLPKNRDVIEKEFTDRPIESYKDYIEPFLDLDAIQRHNVHPFLQELQNPILSVRFAYNTNNDKLTNKKRYPTFAERNSYFIRGKKRVRVRSPEDYFLNNPALCDLYAIAFQEEGAISPPRLHHKVDASHSLKEVKEKVYDFYERATITKQTNSSTTMSLDNIIARRLPKLYQPTADKPHQHKNPLFSEMLPYLKRNNEDFDNGQVAQLPNPNVDRYIPPMITTSHLMQQINRNKKDVLLSACPLHSYPMRQTFMQEHPEDIILTGYASPESYLAALFGGAWIAGENSRDNIRNMYYMSKHLYYPNHHKGSSYQDITAKQINQMPVRFSLDEIVKAVIRSLRPDNIHASEYT